MAYQGGRDPARGYPPRTAAPGRGRHGPQTGPQPAIRTGPQPAIRTGPQPIPLAQAVSGTGTGAGTGAGTGTGPIQTYPETGWHVPGQDITDSRQTPIDRGDRRGRKDRRRGRRGRRKLVLAGAALVILAAGGAAGYKFLHKAPVNPITSGALKLPTSNPTAQSSYYLARLGKWQHIGTRKLDPAPLTVTELYPPAFMLSGQQQYQRAAVSMDQSCGFAVFGSQLQSDFQSGSCSQVVRATYVSGDQKIMGTIGVVNLSSTYWSEQAAKATSASDEFIAPLSTAKGITKNILDGTGLTFTAIKGHYLILMYVEFTNLKAPTSDAQKQQLTDFSQGMLSGSANIALSTRMISGKP